MHQVREILHLSLDAGLSARVVGERSGVITTTVRDTLRRLRLAGLEWPTPNAELEAKLYGISEVKPGRRKQPEPDQIAGGARAEAKACDAPGPAGRVYRRST